METLIKLQEIAVHMDLEPAEETTLAAPTVAPCGLVVDPAATQTPAAQTRADRKAADKRAALGISHAALPNGRTIPLLKTMLTTACERNCNYCPFRAGRNYRRVTFTPDEMAGAFMTMQRADMVEGLFLSSGIIGGGPRIQDKLLDTVDILRNKHQFRGYIHLKVMPGSERDQVRRAMQLADRLSVNLEGATPDRLRFLAPLKQFVDELLTPLRWMEEIRQEELPHDTWNGRWPSSTTQFVVGAAGESDVELLSITEYLLRQLRLRRTYYSAFRPLMNTPWKISRPRTPGGSIVSIRRRTCSVIMALTWRKCPSRRTAVCRWTGIPSWPGPKGSSVKRRWRSTAPAGRNYYEFPALAPRVPLPSSMPVVGEPFAASTIYNCWVFAPAVYGRLSCWTDSARNSSCRCLTDCRGRSLWLPLLCMLSRL
ncbi:MAG: radical SAM protein [Chloroflexota bacterium]